MVIYPVKHVSWNEVVDWSIRLTDKVKSSGYLPDVVVAIGRGGIVVSRIICDLLDINRLIVIPIRWRETKRTVGESYLADLVRCFSRSSSIEMCIADIVKNLSIEVVFEYNIDLNGYRALAVEEISATGLHLAKARDIIKNIWRADEVKTATLIWKAATSPLKPDYTFIETKSFVWFQFPWSRTSDYQQFAKVAIEEEYMKHGKDIWTLEDIVELFRKWYGFEPERRYLEIALAKLIELGTLEKVNEIYRVSRGR
ncbi:MAG: phosphoribosyltransferase family protein [Ignisphaera sp.]